jgi:Domain of unknown function (DUF4253)
MALDQLGEARVILRRMVAFHARDRTIGRPTGPARRVPTGSSRFHGVVAGSEAVGEEAEGAVGGRGVAGGVGLPVDGGGDNRRVVDDGILDRYERAGVHLPALRRACVTGGGLPVWTLQPAREPFASWRRLHALHDRTGLWPFLAGSQLVDRLWQNAAIGHDPTAVERGLALDVGAFFARRAAWLAAPDPTTLAVDPAAPALADREPRFAFTSRDTVIGLIQARHGYEVPGLLSWQGAVNSGLDGALHVAVLRSWHERYGAELVTLAFDQIELLVPRPPREPAAIAQVAVEMYGYCPDLVSQGAGTVEALANEDVARRCWSFWWD